MTASPPARTAYRTEYAALAEVLVSAFHRDPLARWMFPDPDERDRRHRAMFLAALDGTDPTQRIDTTEDLSAVAVWRYATAAAEPHAPDGATGKADALFAAIAAAAPAPPYTTLAFIGARVSGTGAGGALLRHGLAQAEGAVALWTANAANLPFYARAGLAADAPVTVGGMRAWWLRRR